MIKKEIKSSEKVNMLDWKIMKRKKNHAYSESALVTEDDGKPLPFVSQLYHKKNSSSKI